MWVSIRVANTGRGQRIRGILNDEKFAKFSGRDARVLGVDTVTPNLPLRLVAYCVRCPRWEFRGTGSGGRSLGGGAARTL